jgi:hypothetical protein
MFRFNAAKPTSLLYRQEPDGKFVFLGVMYTAPARASLDELERRIPLAVARWHEHVNWCVPQAGHRERWRETRDGAPVFGPQSADRQRRRGRAVPAAHLRLDGARDGVRE